jgi:hypothetical protein
MRPNGVRANEGSLIEDNLSIIIDKSVFVTFYCYVFAIPKAGPKVVISNSEN